MLTLTEIERAAYAAGNQDLADMTARAIDLQEAAQTLLGLLDGYEQPDEVRDAMDVLREALQ